MLDSSDDFFFVKYVFTFEICKRLIGSFDYDYIKAMLVGSLQAPLMAFLTVNPLAGCFFGKYFHYFLKIKLHLLN